MLCPTDERTVVARTGFQVSPMPGEKKAYYFIGTDFDNLEKSGREPFWEFDEEESTSTVTPAFPKELDESESRDSSSTSLEAYDTPNKIA